MFKKVSHSGNPVKLFVTRKLLLPKSDCRLSRNTQGLFWISKTLLKVTPRDFRLENVVQSASQTLKTADLICSESNFEVPEDSKLYDPCRQFF